MKYQKPIKTPLYYNCPSCGVELRGHHEMMSCNCERCGTPVERIVIGKK